jgi:hypothetical protein
MAGQTNPTLIQIEQALLEKTTPENKGAVQKAVLAGEKVMFDEKTHANMEIVKNPEGVKKNPPQAIAMGVAGLSWLLFMQSKKTMKTEVLIMAGTILLTKAIDFAERGYGIKFDNAMIAQSTKILAEALFNKLGISPEQLSEAIQKGRGEIEAQQQGGQPQGAA